MRPTPPSPVDLRKTFSPQVKAQAADAGRCPWTLGYRQQESCGLPLPQDEDLCGLHQAVEEKIRRRAQQIINEFMKSAEAGSRSAVRKVASARELAEDWWRKRGVRAMSGVLYEDVRDSGPCAYCGFTAPSVVDHIVPVTQGGLSVRENLAPACWGCNAEKGDRTPEQWRADRLRAGLCWPPLQPPQIPARSARLVSGQQLVIPGQNLQLVLRSEGPPLRSSRLTGHKAIIPRPGLQVGQAHRHSPKDPVLALLMSHTVCLSSCVTPV